MIWLFSFTVVLPHHPSSPWRRWLTGSGSTRSWTTRFLPSWTSTWSQWKQTVPRWSTYAASSPQSTSRWPPPASVDVDPAQVGKGEGTEPRTAGRAKLDGMRPGNKVRLGMPTTHEDAPSHPALFECMFFCTIPVIGFTCSFLTWGGRGGGGGGCKMYFSSMKWSGFSLWFLQSNTSLWSHIAVPNAGVLVEELHASTAPGAHSHRRSNGANQHPQWHVPPATEQEGLKTSPWFTLWGEEGMKAGCHLWQHPEDQAMGAEEPCRAGLGWLHAPGCGASFVLSATSSAFLASVKGSFGTWVSE